MRTDSARRRISRFLACVSGAALTALVAVAPAGGAVATFGANLNGLADFAGTCVNAASW